MNLANIVERLRMRNIQKHPRAGELRKQGWFTVDDASKASGMGLSHTKQLLDSAVPEDLERKRFSFLHDSGSRANATFYREKGTKRPKPAQKKRRVS